MWGRVDYWANRQTKAKANTRVPEKWAFLIISILIRIINHEKTNNSFTPCRTLRSQCTMQLCSLIDDRKCYYCAFSHSVMSSLKALLTLLALINSFSKKWSTNLCENWLRLGREEKKRRGKKNGFTFFSQRFSSMAQIQKKRNNDRADVFSNEIGILLHYKNSWHWK